MSGWENGKITPPREMIDPLCNALNVPADYFDDVLPPQKTYKDIGTDCLLYNPAADKDRRELDKCSHTNCARCGWYTQEQERREALLREQGLTRLENGLKGLKIEAEGGAVR